MKNAIIQLILFVASLVLGILFFKDIQLAVCLTLALAIHELGHVMAYKMKGISVKGVYFIPLIGAVTASDQEVSAYRDEVFIAFMGPLVNLITGIMTGIFIFAFIFVTRKAPALDNWAIEFTIVSILLGLLNLLPIFPLDGGHILRGIIYSIKSSYATIFSFASIIPVGMWAVINRSYAIIVIAFLTLLSLTLSKNEVPREKMSAGLTIWYAALYVSIMISPLALFLFFGGSMAQLKGLMN